MERADCTDRARLRGQGEEILILVVQHASPAQLTDWLKLPLELSEGDADFLLKPNECCQVRRKGEQVLTVVMERASPKQWSKWLQIPLEHALRARKSNLVDQLIAAGPRLSGPAVDAINIYRASAGVCAGGGSGGGGGGGNGGRREAGKMAGCCPRVRLVPARPSSSCCKPPEDAPAATAATAAVAAAVVASDASGPSCCPSSSGSPEFAISPVACRERRRRSGLPAAERRETSNATPRCPPAVAVARCAPVSCGDANLDIPIPVIDVDGAAALVNSDKLCLHRATMARDLVRMRQIIGGGVDRNATDLWSCTALHRAAEQDDAEPVRLLLAAGLDVRARDMEGYSPLHFASARGAATAIVDLLAAGSCLSATGLNGDTPLHSAVRFLSLPTVRILLASDADESAKNCEGHTPADVTGVLPDGREIENQPDPLMAQSILALLAAAPAQRRLRTWKRRAWLVMLRARAQAEALKAVVDLDLGVRVGDDVGPAPAADHAVAADNEKVEDALPCVPSKCCGGGGDVDAGDVGGGDVSAGVVGAGAVSGAAVSGDAASADAVSGGVVRAGGGCGGGAGAGVLEEEGDATDSELSDLVDQTTGLAEEGVFQKIVRFL